jgi:hypothetical protein
VVTQEERYRDALNYALGASREAARWGRWERACRLIEREVAEALEQRSVLILSHDPLYPVREVSDKEPMESARRQTDAPDHDEPPTPAPQNPVSAPHAHGGAESASQDVKGTRQ